MHEKNKSLLLEQLHGLETGVPQYDYEGLSLPEGLIVDALFGSHGDIGDLSETKANLKCYDYVVIENLGWNESTMKLMQKVANGNYASREKALREIQLQNSSGPTDKDHQILGIKAIYDIKKPLMFIDPPKDHPVYKKIRNHFVGTTRFSLLFSTAITDHKSVMLDHAATNLERENYMLRSFCDQFSTIANTNPRVAGKLQNDGLRVVLFDFGFTHAGLYNGIKEVSRRNGVEFKGNVVVDSGPSVVIDYTSQALGRILHGQEIDDLLVAKDIVCKVLLVQLLSRNSVRKLSQIEAVAIAIDLIDNMSIEELSVKYDQLKIK